MLRTLLEQFDVRPAPLAPPDEALKKMLFFVNSMARPFYLGQLADAIGCSLERTEQYAEHLVTLSVLRRVAASEISPGSNIRSAVAYCVTKVDIVAAHLA